MVTLPSEVQFKICVPPAVVPMAYWYPLMPLSLSVVASQLADNCVVELVVEISAPVPSRTLAGGLGGVDVHDRLAAGIGGVLPVSPAPLTACTLT